MFERVAALFDAERLPAQTMAEYIVGNQLHKGMADPDTKRVIATVSDAHNIDEKVIKKEVLDKRGELLGRLESLIELWRRLDDRLASAEDSRELGIGIAKLKQLAVVTLTAMIIAILVSAACAQIFDLEFLLWGIALTPLLYLPLRFQLDYRERLEENLDMPELRRARTATEKRLEFAAANLATVAIRETINERVTSFSTEFCLLDDRGLQSLADPEREVSTAASKELSTTMASLSSGSIGLSGPRGIGKTTLIDSFACGRSVPLERERVGLVVSAPVKYDAKDFVLHLFASLCERVIGEERLAYLQARGSLHERRRLRLINVFGILILLVAAVGGAMLVFDKTAPEGPQETGYLLLVVTGLLAFGWVEFVLRSEVDWDGLGLGWLSRLAGHRADAPRGTPERTAQNLLEQIRFQQSISSGLTGSFSLPFGLTVGGESNVTMARAPWTLPEAVEAFRKYAASLAKDNYLVIGIDELDKMGSEGTAREFLNNVKGVFGVPGCYYLVSISDDAMASFERRGMPVRDVFDSSFDAVQRVDYLTMGESRAVLESRIIGLPVPYQCLCHCMAGGLPRDLIRVARELVHQAKQNEVSSLEGLAKAVVEAELRAKMAGSIEVSREATGRGSGQLRKWLDEQGAAVADAEGLRESVVRRCEWAAMSTDSAEELLSFEVAAFNYYAATLLELFRDGPGLIERLQIGVGSREVDDESIDVLEALAKARQQFSISPELAWERIAEAREALGLESWAAPGNRSMI